MGSTMPVVPSTEIPPTMPIRGLKVCAASAAPSGMEISTWNPPARPREETRRRSSLVIISRGERLIAAAPTG